MLWNSTRESWQRVDQAWRVSGSPRRRRREEEGGGGE